MHSMTFNDGVGSFGSTEVSSGSGRGIGRKSLSLVVQPVFVKAVFGAGFFGVNVDAFEDWEAS